MRRRRYHHCTIIDASNIFLESCVYEIVAQVRNGETLLMTGSFSCKEACSEKFVRRVVYHLSRNRRCMLNISQRIACSLILSRPSLNRETFAVGYNFAFFCGCKRRLEKLTIIYAGVEERRALYLKDNILYYPNFYDTSVVI